jgi:serine/threonine-protein kinase
MIGKTIAERYLVEAPLGEGGMGSVYLVQHTAIRKRMALKILHSELLRNPDAVARFEREAIAAAQIDHPHVVAASDYGRTEDGVFFLVLEFVEGQGLREVLTTQGALPIPRALHIARQITSGLARAHELGIVHRGH